MFSKKEPIILMLEDNVNNHPLFNDAFTAAGFKVNLAQNAESGFVELVAELMPDIISMDIMIGKSGADLQVGGLDALAMLKADERTKDIPVMMMTNFYEEEKVRKAKELGAVDFLNLQGSPITKMPNHFKKYLEKPKKYVPSHPIF